MTTDSDYKCTAFRSLENGVRFTVPPWIQKGDPEDALTVGLSAFCESLAQVAVPETDESQCRKADRNINTSLFTKEGGQDCVIETYNNPDPDKFDERNTRIEPSRCGFNRDARGVCPIVIGDDYAYNLIHSYLIATRDFDCHRLSHRNAASGSICSEIWALRETQEVFNGFRFGHILGTFLGEDPAQVWANTANNDQ